MTADLTRVERLVWCLIEDFHNRHGVDADNPAGMHLRADIWDKSEQILKPRLIPLEEILGNFEEIHRLQWHNVAVSGGGDREVWPNDADYCTVRDQEVEGIKQTITAQIRELLN